MFKRQDAHARRNTRTRRHTNESQQYLCSKPRTHITGAAFILGPQQWRTVRATLSAASWCMNGLWCRCEHTAATGSHDLTTCRLVQAQARAEHRHGTCYMDDHICAAGGAVDTPKLALVTHSGEDVASRVCMCWCAWRHQHSYRSGQRE